jgi:hypothetical protein
LKCHIERVLTPPKSQPESEAVQKGAPYFVLPSVSEASLACARDGVLTSFGTASPPLCPPEARKRRGTPRLTPRGDEKKEARGDSRRACTKTFLVQPQVGGSILRQKGVVEPNKESSKFC